jgi:putative heme-binding domain-containing protein
MNYRINSRRFLALLTAALLSLVLPPVVAGEADDPANVTAKVAAAVKDGGLSVEASNEVFGDPAEGVAKKLTVEFRLGSDTMTRDVKEGGTLEIPAAKGKELVILKAVYGPADGLAPPSVEAAAEVAALAERPGELLETLPGFVVEHVLRADRKRHGSWICLQLDPQGRLLLGGEAGQPITRVTLKDGKAAGVEVLTIPVSETMGMLCVGEALYLNGNGPKGFGLYRCRDKKGDGSYGAPEFLREWPGGSGDHGAHALLLGPDKMLYAVCGNFTAVPRDLAPTSPHRNYADDLAIQRMEDGNGFGANHPPPGGYVLRMDLDGKNAELFSSGQRNNYDIAFNADGELFGYDSDMEYDWATPWYRPTRIFHAIRGGDHGFREGSAKWPEHYEDSLPATVNIGIGSPTGVTFGAGARFPAEYQRALFACDWTYGRLMAVHLKPDGASYTGTWENFVAPRSLKSRAGKTPLNLTDVIVGPDGALYFITGGRRTQSDLLRVTYRGTNAAAPLAAAQLQEENGRAARELQRSLESWNARPDSAAVPAAWSHLGNPDRFIRYAARMAIERNPVAEWQHQALTESRPDAAFTALLALARLGGADQQPAIFKALAVFPFTSLTPAQALAKLRVIEVSIARRGAPQGEVAARLIAELGPRFPGRSEVENRELCRILIALDAPDAVAKAMTLLGSAWTLEEQIVYLMALRKAKTGWTDELRRDYLTWWTSEHSQRHPEQVVAWFADAGINFNTGASLPGYMEQIRNEFIASLTLAEVTAIGDLAAAKPARAAPTAPRKLVKEWTTADLQPALAKVSRGRDFARGKVAFEAAQCILCHRYGEHGGAAGPDLTNVATRFKRQDLLESMTEPSKVVSEQYTSTVLTLNDGTITAGRIRQETAESIVLMPNAFDPATTITVPKTGIRSRELSKVSIMPPGLLNTLTEDEILDLIAFMESMGDPAHPNFSK